MEESPSDHEPPGTIGIEYLANNWALFEVNTRARAKVYHGLAYHGHHEKYLQGRYPGNVSFGVALKELGRVVVLERTDAWVIY